MSSSIEKMEQGHEVQPTMSIDQGFSTDAKLDIGTVENAQQATRLQHELTLREAARLYRPAIGWSFLFSLGVIM